MIANVDSRMGTLEKVDGEWVIESSVAAASNQFLLYMYNITGYTADSEQPNFLVRESVVVSIRI